jgi:FAD/FMN-containing dehydrogenase
VDRHPAVIVRCADPSDVARAVTFARDNDLLLAVRGGGHNAAGYGTCDGGIVVDLSPMRGVDVDRANRTARVQGGATWGDFDQAAQTVGLATTGGMISNTGVGGLSLGGGEGWLQGKHGLTCDNLLGADLVTADGRHIRASVDENPDLFWGLRGGGGNFGVVTSFEFRLHEVGPTVLGGMVIHPLTAARDVLRFYREFSADLPDEAEAYLLMLTSPDGLPIVALLLGYNGSIEEGARVLEPARRFGAPVADLIQPMPYVARQTMLDEGMANHGIQRYWKSGYARELSDELLEGLVSGAMEFPTPMTAIAIFNLHGAVARVPFDATAFASRERLWDVNAIAQWVDPAATDSSIAWTRRVWSSLEPHTIGTSYVNHIASDDRPERVRASYGGNYPRLVALKNTYDPTNLFRLNPNVRPSAQGAAGRAKVA